MIEEQLDSVRPALSASGNGAMADHDIMREMAYDYRRRAQAAQDPARRETLRELAAYCQKMAVAMEKIATNQKPT
jgi:hypothetical protein